MILQLGLTVQITAHVLCYFYPREQFNSLLNTEYAFIREVHMNILETDNNL